MYILGIVDVPFWVLVLIVLALLYYYLTATFSTWTSRDVPGPKPWLLVGTMGSMFTKGITPHDAQFRKYGKLAGGYEGRTPTLYVYDLAMLREILVKQFDCFTDRVKLDELEEIIGKFMTTLHGAEWRNVRTHVTPTFTSGKMRKMFPMICECSEVFKNSIEEKIEAAGKIDTRTLSSGYTMDVIARTAFGIDVDSQKDPDNEFMKMAKAIFEFDLQTFFVVIMMFIPFTAKVLSKMGLLIYLKGSKFSKSEAFFQKITDQIMADRRGQKADDRRADFIQLMVEAEQEAKDEDGKLKKKGLSAELINAQAMLFFVAGYETTSGALTFLAYNLALNPEVQDKLCEEIDRALEDKDELDYETVQNIPYLDQCIEESLRLFSPGARLERICTRDVTINGFQFKKDDRIVIPVDAIHKDEENYPDPLKFHPDRFSPENKEARNPYAWQAFGAGPRNCIGMRLALLELRVAMVTLLRTHKFVTVDDTPMILNMKLNGLLNTKETMYLGFVNRNP